MGPASWGGRQNIKATTKANEIGQRRRRQAVDAEIAQYAIRIPDQPQTSAPVSRAASATRASRRAARRPAAPIRCRPFPFFRHPAMPLIILFLKTARRPVNPIFPSCSPILRKAAPAVRRRDAESAIPRNQAVHRRTAARTPEFIKQALTAGLAGLANYPTTQERLPCVRRSPPGWAAATGWTASIRRPRSCR